MAVINVRTQRSVHIALLISIVRSYILVPVFSNLHSYVPVLLLKLVAKVPDSAASPAPVRAPAAAQPTPGPSERPLRSQQRAARRARGRRPQRWGCSPAPQMAAVGPALLDGAASLSVRRLADLLRIPCSCAACSDDHISANISLFSGQSSSISNRSIKREVQFIAESQLTPWRSTHLNHNSSSGIGNDPTS